MSLAKYIIQGGFWRVASGEASVGTRMTKKTTEPDLIFLEGWTDSGAMDRNDYVAVYDEY